MPYPDPIFPGELWNGLTRNPDRTSLERRVDPDLHDWDRIASEVLSVESFLLAGGTQFEVNHYSTNTTLLFLPQVALIDANSGSLIITLPQPTAALFTINVKKIDITTATVTVDGDGNNIDGSPTQIITTPQTSMALATDGTEWFII